MKRWTKVGGGCLLVEWYNIYLVCVCSAEAVRQAELFVCSGGGGGQ